MELGRGEIYFVTEQDGTGHTEFVKIGLVGDSEGRSSSARMKEHQTGNPRPLQLLDVVETVFVTSVESRLHSEFAVRRVSGEWFRLDAPTLTAAVERCKTLAVEYEREIPILEQAERLSAIPSKPELAEETPESQSWREQQLVASYGESILDGATSRLKYYLKSLHATGKDVSHVARISERPGKLLFDSKVFRERFPDLWAQCQITRTRISNSGMRVSSRGDLPGEGLGIAEAKSLSSKLFEGIDSADSSQTALSELHDVYLDMIGLQPLFAEQKAQAGAHLKILCGEHSGIVNVCTWKRSLKEETTLDEAMIKDHYSNEYLACTSLGAPSVVINIHRRTRIALQPSESAET